MHEPTNEPTKTPSQQPDAAAAAGNFIAAAVMLIAVAVILVWSVRSGCDGDEGPKRSPEERERRAAEVRAEQEQAKFVADFKDGMAEMEREAAEWRAKKRTKAEYRDDRKRYAERLESYLESVSQVEATVRSSGRTYRVSWPLCDASTIDEIAVDKDMTVAVQVLKVNRLECSDGHTTWTKTWR